MGCGQSKINLYPRRNKNGGKGNSAKKSGAADKDTDDEEGSSGTGAAKQDENEDDVEQGKQILPLSANPPTVEISASQQDFFKMLDDRIDKGKDYDSSSETEVKIEHERRKVLIDQWRSTSQSTMSSLSQSSPPTPARRRVPRPLPPERHSSPGASRRCYRQQQHVTDSASPPPKRALSAQQHHHSDRQMNGDRDWNQDSNRSPIKRPQSAGANWKSNPKVLPFNQKPKKNDMNEQQRSCQKEYEQMSNSVQDISQITYNPTFQSQSPVHSGKNQQPYITQIVTYPMSQQVTPPSPPKFIAPPEEYQDKQNEMHDNKYANAVPRQTPPMTPNSQSIYFIHGNGPQNVPQDIVQQRQQTALHLQQYVAMKQAQQQMYSYIQRSPHSVFPSVDCTQRDSNRIYDHEEYTQYGHAIRPHSAPAPVGVVRPMPMVPGINSVDGSHMGQMPMWSPMPAVAGMGPWVPGQDIYYPQSQFSHLCRPNSAGSAGTLTRYHKEKTGVPQEDGKKKNLCQSINVVRQKAVGQIVMDPDHTVRATDSPASDSGSATNVSSSHNPLDNKRIKPYKILKNSKSLDSS